MTSSISINIIHLISDCENKPENLWSLSLPKDERYLKSKFEDENEYERYLKSKFEDENEYYALRDDLWCATFGKFQESLRELNEEVTLVINFDKLSWIDPLPLLGIINTVSSFIESTGSSLKLSLGDSPENDQLRGAFLKYLASHHFLRGIFLRSDDFTGKVIISYNGEELSELEKFFALEENLTSLMCQLEYDDSICLKFKLVQIGNDFEVGTIDLVNRWVDEIVDNGLTPIFEKRKDLVDFATYKLRVVLYEIVDNAFRHAFEGNASLNKVNAFSVYGRLRKRSFDNLSKYKLNEAIRLEKKFCPTISSSHISHRNDWLEIFYYDDGKGLLSDLPKWVNVAKEKKEVERAEFDRVLLKIKKTSNKLNIVSRLLFSNPISCLNRTDRTALTGLQHIGISLVNDLDFIRVLVDREWVGSPHPWNSNLTGGTINYGKMNEWVKLSHTKGTAWHFCIAVRTHDVQLDENWVQPDRSNLYNVEPEYNNYVSDQDDFHKIAILDERLLTPSSIFDDDISVKSNARAMIWLPSDITKQNIRRWLVGIGGAINQIPKYNIEQVIIADLPTFTASIVAQILRSEKVYTNKVLDIYIISIDWNVTCVTNMYPRANALQFDKDKAEQFSKRSILKIFRYLRFIDSEIFWHDIPNQKPNEAKGGSHVPFVYEQVAWESSTGDETILDGYLDLSQALTSPQKAEICQRALARACNLFEPKATYIAADSLLSDLIPYSGGQNYRLTDRVYIGSVLVSGSTVTSKRNRAEGSALHLFKHDHISSDIKPLHTVSEPIALEWMRDSPQLLTPPPGKLPFCRIPDTPFIGRGGNKAIPIRRFDRPEAGDIGFFEKNLSLYGEPPQEMYDHMLRLGALKMGHWQYEGHHDLFTVNLAKAYRIERGARGPLVRWLLEKLKKFGDSCALIYPSHAVTDNIIRDLQYHHPDSLPKHVVPIKFLGNYSQSSIRIPSLTYDRIRMIFENEDSENLQAILFDDGTITGKVAREVEQLVRNANTTRSTLIVNTITLVNRTGLPLYRRLIKHTKNYREHYWRWDVPPLGNRRTCPLCRAIAEAKQLALSFIDIETRSIIISWIEKWEVVNVIEQWENTGISPLPLSHPRPMTFGKEWLPNFTYPIAYDVLHSSTTSLASMVIELIRSTSYKKLGLKIADKPEGENVEINHRDIDIWVHAKLEILTSQILLFYDDLNFDELNERYIRLLILLLFEDHEVSPELKALARVVLLLAEPHNAVHIIQSCSDLFFKEEVQSTENFLTFGYLLKKAKSEKPEIVNDIKSVYPPPHRTFTKNVGYSEHLISGNEIDPYVRQRNALKMLVLLLGETATTMHHGFLRDLTVNFDNADTDLIVRDLKILKTVLLELKEEFYLSKVSLQNGSDDCPRFDPHAIAEEVQLWIDRIQSNTVKESVSDTVRKLHHFLFGESVGVATIFQNDVVADPEILLNSIKLGISNSTWDKTISQKMLLNEGVKVRWLLEDGTTFYPEICTYVNCDKLPVALCPPLVKKYIQDLMLNVIYSNRSLIENDTEGTVDMACYIREEDDFISILFRNCTDTDNIPHFNMIGSTIDDFFQHDFVEHKVAHRDGIKMIETRLKLPTVKRLRRDE